MQNVDPRFPKLLNELAALRAPARYLARDFALTDTDMDEMLAVAEEMHAAVEASRPRRAPATSSSVRG
jgi:hypothetical protein